MIDPLAIFLFCANIMFCGWRIYENRGERWPLSHVLLFGSNMSAATALFFSFLAG